MDVINRKQSEWNPCQLCVATEKFVKRESERKREGSSENHQKSTNFSFITKSTLFGQRDTIWTSHIFQLQQTLSHIFGPRIIHSKQKPKKICARNPHSPNECEKNANNIVIGLGMRIKSRTTECVHVETDKENKTQIKQCEPSEFISESKIMASALAPRHEHRAKTMASKINAVVISERVNEWTRKSKIWNEREKMSLDLFS